MFMSAELMWLVDDDFVSLIGLTVLADPSCRQNLVHFTISQLHLSLYLLTQCQMKLHHSVTSLARTLEYVKLALASLPRQTLTLDLFALKFTARIISSYMIENVLIELYCY